MSKLKNERAEIKNETGASSRQQKKYAPAVRRWNERMRKMHEARMNAAITKMIEAYNSTKDLV